MSDTEPAPTSGYSYPDTFAGRLRALVDAWRNRVPDNGIIAEGPDYGAPYLLWSDLDAALTENVQLERALDNLRFEMRAIAPERVEPISDERTLRDQLVAAGTAAAEEWLATRANRRMFDVNRKRLAGHVVNALWQQIEQATVEIAQWIAEDDRAELARVRAELDARIAAESADAAAGSYAGRAEAAEAERDAVQAEATLLRRALIGRRAFPVGVMRTPMDERTEAIRARWDEFCFSGPSETDRERDQVIGWLLDRMDSATSRAEQAEAALAEMRELKSVLVMLLMRSGGTVEFSTAERVQTSMRGEFVSTVDRVTGVMRLKFTPQENATPRTALERAADEQGVREGGGDE